MRIDYDAETDTLRVVLKDTPVRESEEELSGVILDYDTIGQLVALEIFDASTRVDTVDSMQLRVPQSPRLSDAAEYASTFLHQPMLDDIVQARRHRLYLRFDDGCEGEIDIESILENGIWINLR